MYFIYRKEINIASDYNYNTIEMVNYFIDQFDPIACFSECGIDSEPADFIAYIYLEHQKIGLIVLLNI